ncbi:MAG: hypothetical protein IPK53_10320 [bacterium]|nr:hypothetical protein [bacterium]
MTEVLINPTDIRASVPTQYSEPTPTLNSSPTPIIITSDKPTPIPVATLTLAERQVLFSELMATNGGCDLPCWWSIELGESLDRINQKFIDLGMPWLIIEESHKIGVTKCGVFNAGYIDEMKPALHTDFVFIQNFMSLTMPSMTSTYKLIAKF